MPLHLLGKKSWNVYNPENIARVHRDEAEAQAREAEEQRHAQERDAERRLAQLRGGEAGVHVREFTELDHGKASKHETGRDTKRRRLAGEDDTDREIRLARQDPLTSQITSRSSRSDIAAPIVDARGHIDLIPQQHGKPQGRNREAEEEKAARQRSYEDQYTMRLANASGLRPGSDKPWYSSTRAEHTDSALDTVSKDAWGNNDARKREREKRRVDANDPLAAMKKGVKQLRDAERQREEWKMQREKDLIEVEELARQRDRRRKRRVEDVDDGDSLDGFDLDDGYSASKDKSELQHRHRHRHRHRQRREHGRHREYRDRDHGRQRDHQRSRSPQRGPL